MRFFLLSIIIFQAVHLSAGVKTGNLAPHFKIMDGNKHWLDSQSLKGKVIIGFYESKHSAKKNDDLKKFLNSFHSKSHKQNTGKTFKLAVVDASEASIITAWVWRKRFREASKQLKITVHGDWDGSMRKRFGFKKNESTFIIIDSKGRIAYLQSGKVPRSSFTKIKGLIKKLVIAAGH